MSDRFKGRYRLALLMSAAISVALLGGERAATAADPAPAAVAATIDVAALEAKYKADAFRRRAKSEQALYEKIIRQQGFVNDATDYLRTGPNHDNINQRKKAAHNEVNKLRAAGKLNSAEYYEAQAEFYRLQAMDYKNLSGGMDRRFNNYDSEWFGKHTMNEWMKGCWGDAKSITTDVWNKKWELLKTCFEKGPAEAIKSLFFETFDATYKVQFVKNAISENGATPRIADFWWNHFVMGNFKKSDLMEVLEEATGKATGKLQEKLEEKVKERISEEVKNKMMETGEKVTSEAVKKTAESAAKNWIKNFVTAPGILIEFTAKYWNVASFEQMFLDAAPNETGYLKEIRRVLTSQNKLNDKEVDRCYFDRKYFLSLRKELGLPKPIVPKPKPKPKTQKTKKGIKIRVRRHLQPEIDTVWEFVEAEAKVKEQVKAMQKDPPTRFDDRPFTDLVDKADTELRTDAIDLVSYQAQVKEVQALYDAAWNAWQGKLLEDADDKERAAVMQRTVAERKKFERYCALTSEQIQKDQETYLNQIKSVPKLNIAERLKKTELSLRAKVDALWVGMEARSKLLASTNVLGCTKPDQMWGNNYEQFEQFWRAIVRTGIYRAITVPEGSVNGIGNDLSALMMGEWFAKSLYDIWHTGTSEHMAMLIDIAGQEQVLGELLHPLSGLWRVKSTDGTLLPEVKKVVIEIERAAQRKRVVSGYNAFAGREDFVHKVLRRQKVAEKRCKSRLRTTKVRVAAQAEELKEFKNWLNTEGQTIEDKGMEDWKTVCHEALMALTAFTAGNSTPEKLEETYKVLEERRLKYLARRKHLDEMLGSEPVMHRELAPQAEHSVFRIEERFKTYLAKYEVPERAIFQEVADGKDVVAPALAVEVKTMGFTKRMAAYYRKPDGLYDGVMVQRGRLPVMINFRWLTQLQANLAYGDVKALASFADLYRKGLKVNDEVNKAARVKLIAFEKKVDDALGKPRSEEVARLLRDEWLAIDQENGKDYWKRIGTMPFAGLKLDAENQVMAKRIHEKQKKLRELK